MNFLASLSRLIRGRKASNSRAQKLAQRKRARRAFLERLEDRSLLAALPYGAMPDDTGEFLLGDVHVTVVLMESDPSLAPRDNLPSPQGIGAPAENWTPAAIGAVKANIQAGLQWWKDTLDAMPAVRDGLLNFNYDWTHADTPVKTGYEPIARVSNDFANWMYDFLGPQGFSTGSFSTDIRAYNNFQRLQNDADWAFTIFVVNNATDADKLFAAGGTFRKAFAFAGGRFMVVPADRPASTYAHEAGHMFWALDEYPDSGASPNDRRGYYNTANTNAGGSEPSIMHTGTLLDTAYAGHTTSQSSREMIGWKDTDNDGIFDVLDVPFSLDGSGHHDVAGGLFKFVGTSSVRTLPNQNTSGLQNDITINRIRQVQYAFDDGGWQVFQTLPDRTYTANLNLAIAVPTGAQSIRIRTIDTRTGVMSMEYVAQLNTPTPTPTPTPGGSGYVWRDDDQDGSWDFGEPPLPDWAIDLVDIDGNPIVLSHKVEPNDYVDGTVVNSVNPAATLSAVGFDVMGPQVIARTSQLTSGGKVFWVNSASQGQVETWTSVGRNLRVDFADPVGMVRLKAHGVGATTFGRLEAYNSAGVLIERATTGSLAGKNDVLQITRPVADIAYVIAKAHIGGEVVFDSLSWGPGSSATSNAQGLYRLAGLPPGTYRAKVNPPAGHAVVTPAGGIHTFTIAAGQVASGLNFGIATTINIWHNYERPLDANGDGNPLINALDLLVIVNWLNTHELPQLPATGDPSTAGFVDVDNNGFANSLDALRVVNHLNLASIPPPSSFGNLPPASNGPGSNNAPPEGETPSEAPATAADYFATNPLHFSDIPGTELPCCCHECIAVHTVESVSLPPTAPVPAAPPHGGPQGSQPLGSNESKQKATRLDSSGDSSSRLSRRQKIQRTVGSKNPGTAQQSPARSRRGGRR